MTNDPLTILACVLEAENAALRAGDYAGATTLLERKQTAAAAIHERLRPSEGVLCRLRDATEENRFLLGRAIRVQARVVGILAQVAAPKPGGYSRRGFAGGDARARPICLRSDV